MTRLPRPPGVAELRSMVRPRRDIVEVHGTTRLVRVYNASGRAQQKWDSFRYTGPLAHARFDPHRPAADGSPTNSADHGVLYFGLSVRTSIAEVYQTSSIVDRHTKKPQLVVIRPSRTLRLLDLVGIWPTRVGASQAISSGPRWRTQEWARVIREACPDLDGLWYRSSMDSGNPAVCLWDPPASSAMPDKPDIHLPLDHPGLDLPLARICEELNYTLLPAD
ncbi:RES domain-containing protein [Pseudonocardiaceae bacterium YIM PH 21723]|nr:RES domain-containing protein [Pseudonocardiaceae bacterium YIM PH 21723]